MKKYKNINDSFDYKGITFINSHDELSSILDLDTEKYQFYLHFKTEYRGCSYQCMKSDENKTTEKISEFNEDEHVRMNDLDYFDRDKFDETNEVHDGRVNVISLTQINSIDFIKRMFNKIKECQSELGENVSFIEFYNWIKLDEDDSYEEMVMDERFNDFIEKLNGDKEDFSEILWERRIDEDENLIDWFSYDMFDEVNLEIGFIEK
ncbi:hypothetical protein N8147_00220 [Flavobacteriaceae bacterium]|nr:hypothetical protein [Flavobacteriaceae bacterium]